MIMAINLILGCTEDRQIEPKKCILDLKDLLVEIILLRSHLTQNRVSLLELDLEERQVFRNVRILFVLNG